MKAKYLELLKEQLKEFQASKDDINDILSDYSQLYDDVLEAKGSDELVWQTLGDPKKQAFELIDSLKIKKEKGIKQKIIALTPFLSLIIFFLLGTSYDLWHPGWLVFLMIPVTAILLSTRLKEGLTALSPFIAVITYMILGFGFDLWHPGWLIFLIIPVISILLHAKFKDIFVSIMPFISVTVFILLGTYYHLWNPGWLVFLAVPMVGILYHKKLWMIIVYELSFIIAIGIYLYVGYEMGSFTYGALGFILPVMVGIILGDVHFIWNNELAGKDLRKVYALFSVIIGSIIAFVLLGILLDGWAYAWQVFLFIPMAAIILFNKFRFTAISPFIAVILFFSLGYFFVLFHVSWLAFLLIPMTAIVENA